MTETAKSGARAGLGSGWWSYRMWDIDMPLACQPPWTSAVRRKGIGAGKALWQSHDRTAFPNPLTHGDGTTKLDKVQHKRKGEVESIVQ